MLIAGSSVAVPPGGPRLAIGLQCTDDQGDLPERGADLRNLRRTFFIVETESHYEALVRLEDGRRRVSRRAREPRWSQGWARHDGGVLLLERVPRVRRNAVAICVLKAYREARAAWREGDTANDEPRDQDRKRVTA